MMFEEFICEIIDEEEADLFDMKKLKAIYEILTDSKLLFLSNTFDIIKTYNRIFQIFVNTLDDDHLTLNPKQLSLLTKIYTYLCLIFELDDYFDSVDIHIRINYYKYHKFSSDIFKELLRYYKFMKNNNNQDLYVCLWNKFLDLKKEPIITRLGKYYATNGDVEFINKRIIQEYVNIFKPKSIITSSPINDKVKLFFLLLLDKV